MDSVVDVPSTGEAHDNDDVAVAAGTVTLLEANPYRKSALIINLGDDDLRVTTDGSDPSATRGKLIAAGGSLTMSSPNCPPAEVKGFCAGATTVNASEVD